MEGQIEWVAQVLEKKSEPDESLQPVDDQLSNGAPMEDDEGKS